MLPTESELVFRLTITDRFGRVSADPLSAPAAAQVLTAETPLPHVSIAGAPELSVPAGRPLLVHGLAKLPSCFMLPDEDVAPALDTSDEAVATSPIDHVRLRFSWSIRGHAHVASWGREIARSPRMVQHSARTARNWIAPRLGPPTQAEILIALNESLTDHERYLESTAAQSADAADVPSGWEALVRDASSLSLPAAMLTSGAVFDLIFSATSVLPSGVLGAAATAHVRISVRSLPWRPAIDGCNRLVARGEQVDISVRTPHDADLYTGTAWSYRWLCAPAPCARSGSALERLLWRMGGGANWSEASTLGFDSDDLAPSASDAADSFADLPNASVSLVFVGEPSLTGDAAVASAADGERILARCELRIARDATPALRVGISGEAESRRNANERLTLIAMQRTADGLLESAPSALVHAWSSDALLASQPATGWTAPHLVLRPHALGFGGGVYTLWLSARDGASGRVGGACWIGQINSPPLGGSVEVSPLDGVSMSTEFRLAARGWSDEPEDLPLVYAFSVAFDASEPSGASSPAGGAHYDMSRVILDGDDGAGDSQASTAAMPLADASLATELSTQLAKGATNGSASLRRVSVRVCDSYGGCAQPTFAAPSIRIASASSDWAHAAGIAASMMGSSEKHA